MKLLVSFKCYLFSGKNKFNLLMFLFFDWCENFFG